MDAVTQQNAVLVEQAAVAAESLREQTGSLPQAVGEFRLGGAGHTSFSASVVKPIAAMLSQALPIENDNQRPSDSANVRTHAIDSKAAARDAQNWEKF